MNQLKEPAFERPRFEVADIFAAYGDEYLNTHPTGRKHIKVMNAIKACRTARYGGHKDKCDTCGEIRISYNSCGDRHCPKCQGMRTHKWLNRMRAVVLPVPYFHVIFTLPHTLYPLVPYNEKALYDLLFHSAASALKKAINDDFGVTPGITAILHTWGQKLNRHIHLHCLVTGGGLSEDQSTWVSSPDNYLVDVLTLSQCFKTYYADGLAKLYHQRKLDLHYPHARALQDRDVFDEFLRILNLEGWNSFSKPPFNGTETVLEYLSRYTHRVAIANRRILSMADNQVVFDYKDYREDGTHKRLKLTANQFIGSFLLHVLPKRFTKIRHYGLFAGKGRSQRIGLCKELLKVTEVEATAHVESYVEMIMRLTNTDITLCQKCQKGHMQFLMEIPPPGRWARCSA
jgi:hypothetical protein